MFGGGVSTYGSGTIAQLEAAQSQFGVKYDSLYSSQQAQINGQLAKEGTNLTFSDRAAPWWKARDDGLAYVLSTASPEMLNHPYTQFAQTVKGAAELEDALVKFIEREYGVTRDEADKHAAEYLEVTGLADAIKNYRYEILRQDPGLAEAWREAYNAREHDWKPGSILKMLSELQE